jgi:hypothetical protein
VGIRQHVEHIIRRSLPRRVHARRKSSVSADLTGFAVSVSVSFAGVRGRPPRFAEGRHAGRMTCGGPWRTVVLRTEKRKVGGSAPPLTTHSDQRKRLDLVGDSGVLQSVRLIFRPKAKRAISGFPGTGSSPRVGGLTVLTSR